MRSSSRRMVVTGWSLNLDAPLLFWLLVCVVCDRLTDGAGFWFLPPPPSPFILPLSLHLPLSSSSCSSSAFLLLMRLVVIHQVDASQLRAAQERWSTGCVQTHIRLPETANWICLRTFWSLIGFRFMINRLWRLCGFRPDRPGNPETLTLIHGNMNASSVARSFFVLAKSKFILFI